MRLLLVLITLTTWSNYGYTWYCTYDQNESGWYDGTSMVCTDISVEVALEQHYCVWHAPNDPYCSSFATEPACSDTVEYRTLACTEPNTIGVVNEVRDYYCQTNTFGPWITTSENCSPAPPTCIDTAETREIACDSGYEGTITQVRQFNCADPYSDGVWSGWVESNRSCSLSVTSPISPLSTTIPQATSDGSSTDPTNPISTNVQPPAIDNVTAPENAQMLTTTLPDLVEPPKEESGETRSNTASKKKEKQEKQEVSTSNSEETESPQESKPKEKEKDEEKQEAPKVPTGKSLVPGFGLTMSMDILDSGVQINQIQLNDVLTLIQEQEYDRQQNILLDLVFQDDVDAGLGSIADYRWRSLLFDNPLQQDGFGD
jgi:hypothetical protein